MAIIGGGVAGATACTFLCDALLAADDGGGPAGVDIDVYDQGRGLGGRTAHRAYARAGDEWRAVDPEAPGAAEGEVLRFNHGCQFFTARGEAFARLVERWRGEGWCEEWRARRGVLRAPSPPSPSPRNAPFFGLREADAAYVGAGGMHRMAIGMLRSCEARGREGRVRVSVRRGVRVAKVARDGRGWRLLGTSGEAAAHDSPEALAAAAAHGGLGPAHDIVIVTDVSCSFGGWHRASAGLPPEAARVCEGRVRVPLFTCLVAFDGPLPLALEAVGFADDDVLWFAGRTAGDRECWTLVSTERYAVAEISRVPMQDAATGAFIPQSREYLEGEGGPARTMLRAFTAAVRAQSPGSELPRAVFVSAQRWGSAFASHANRAGGAARGGAAVVDVMGVRYSASERFPRAPGAPAADDGGRDFFHDDRLGLYYAGDFMVSSATSDAGVEVGVGSAAMSGAACAEHVARVLRGARQSRQ